MALTFGFFNSVDGDRKYNAAQMSEMFDGLICDGVYQTVGDAMRVVAGTDLAVNVSTGRARINSQWAKVDAAHAITLNAAHVTLNRYTAICLRLDYANRTISLIARDGANATKPTKPAIVRNEYYYELILAYVYVAAGATAITQSNIQDTRANTKVCGIVSSLVQQLDTSRLFEQYETAYEEQLAAMQTWFTTEKASFNTWLNAQKTAFTAWMTQRKNEFDAWFEDLTEELSVDTYITSATANYTVTSSTGERYLDVPASLNYATADVLIVYINGVNLAHGIDYVMQQNEVSGGYMAVLNKKVAAGNVITFTVIKSDIGTPKSEIDAALNTINGEVI